MRTRTEDFLAILQMFLEIRQIEEDLIESLPTLIATYRSDPTPNGHAEIVQLLQRDEAALRRIAALMQDDGSSFVLRRLLDTVAELREQLRQSPPSPEGIVSEQEFSESEDTENREDVEDLLIALGAQTSQIAQFTCPITRSIITHPVKITRVDPSGRRHVQFYEREALLHALASQEARGEGRFDPVSRLPLAANEPLPAPEYEQQLQNFITELRQPNNAQVDTTSSEEASPQVNQTARPVPAPVHAAQHQPADEIIRTLDAEIRNIRQLTVAARYADFLRELNTLRNMLNADFAAQQQANLEASRRNKSKTKLIARAAISLLQTISNPNLSRRAKEKAVYLFKVRCHKERPGVRVLKCIAAVAVAALTFIAAMAVGMGIGMAVGAWGGPLAFFTGLAGAAAGAVAVASCASVGGLGAGIGTYLGLFSQKKNSQLKQVDRVTDHALNALYPR